MPPAVAIAGIGAAASIGGAVLGASSAKKAANQAADATRDAGAANTALARETYSQNAQRLDPTVTGGQTAGNAIMSILGFPSGGTGTATDGVQHTQQFGTPEPAPPEGSGGGIFGNIRRREIIQAIQAGRTVDPAKLAAVGLTDYASKYQAWKNGGTATGQPMTSGNAMAAFDTFRNSSDYKFRFDQGVTAEQQGMGALGAFDSGATRKALTEYGQHFASGELGNWMDRLAQQQGFGLGAASALAGVSQNMAGQQIAANNNTASAVGNAALVRGNANANMYGQVAGALGGLASSFFPKG